jgi:hypothetical protein
MPSTRRRIGPVGTAVRAAGGLGLIYLAGAVDGTPWDVDWYDPLVGFVVLPAIMLAVVLTARRYAVGPIRFTGPVGIGVNAAVIVALLSSDYTPPAERFSSTAHRCFSPRGWARQVARPPSSRTCS